jgi:non-specific serine/threonine protein kinase
VHEEGSDRSAPVAVVAGAGGLIVALAAGEDRDAATAWRAAHDAPALGARLLRLAGDDGPLAPDLAFGRTLARAVLRELAAGAGTPAPDAELAVLATAADAAGLTGVQAYGMRVAWDAVAAAATAAGERGELLRRHGVDPELGRVWFHLAERADPARPFAFMATVACARRADGELRHTPLAAAAAGLDRAGRARLLAPVERAAARESTVRALVASHELFHAVAWTAAEAHALLRCAPTLTAAGVRVRAPAWAQGEPLRPQVRVELGARAPTSLGLAALLDFRLRYFLGDAELSADEWRRLTAAAVGLHRVGDRWVQVDPTAQAQARAQWAEVEAAAGRGAVGFGEGLRLLAGLPRGWQAATAPVWTVARPGPWLARTLADLQDPRGSVEADPGPALNGTLRPYQRDGVAWLWLLSRLGLGGCLADDMGLGKTIQVVALLLLLRRDGAAGPHLVVLPASLLGNWRAELARFAPDLRVHVAHRSAGDVDAPPAGEVDVVLTTYATLLRQAWLRAHAWGLVVLDEAQAIKSAAAKQTRAVKALTSRGRLVLTGTPVENSLVDLWSLLDFACPGLLGRQAEFKAFCKRLAEQGDGLAPLRALVRPYVLRRVKTDRRVIADLPDKTEVSVYCGLTRVQAGLYARAVEELAREVAGATGIRRRGVILAYLTKFKQICNHPAQVAGEGAYAPEDSGKFQRLLELCAAIAEAGERLLVFTQFRAMCRPLAELLAGCFGRPGLVLHGETPVAARAGLVEEFQAGDGPPFMVLSLRAGGTGLNLTAAQHVVHFDRWWNPAVENQATDRAYRIGQRRNVLVHKFVCRGTLEERIEAMLASKRGLADEVLADDGSQRLTEMDGDELLRVVSLDLRAALTEDEG